MTKYPSREDSPSRMSRKRSRNQIFVKNRKEGKLRKEAKRLKRQTAEEGD